jgi:ribosome maturation factor RimP
LLKAVRVYVASLREGLCLPALLADTPSCALSREIRRRIGACRPPRRPAPTLLNPWLPNLVQGTRRVWVALDRLEEMARGIAQAHDGLEIYDVRMTTQRGRQVVQVTVLRPGEKGGATIGDCTLVARELGQMLEEEDPFSHAYTLEVSSPGIERDLRRPEHFGWALGETVHIVLSEAVEGWEQYEGILEAFDPESQVITVAAGKRRVDIAYGIVRKARTRFAF